MQLGFLGNILALMYSDKLTVKRHTATVAADGTTKPSINPTAVVENVACHISFKSDDETATTDNSFPIYLPIKVFADASVDIQKGDILIADKIGDDGSVVATYTGTATKPLQFISHQEVMFKQVGDA